MKILFSTFGSLGDIHPYIAIALEAKKRGHEPVLATAPKYRAKIEGLGIGFCPIRPDLPPENEFGELARRVMDLKDGPRYLFQDILMPSLRDSYADLLEAAYDADVIITHPAALAGPLVAQKLGKKWLSSVLAPISLWSKTDPPVPPTLPQLDILRALGPLWSKIFIGAGKMGTKSWIAEVETLREEIGLGKGKHPMFEGQFSPYGTLALFSPHFAAPQKDWPNSTTATGFCFYDAEGYRGQKTEAWREWIERNEEGYKENRPIVFTLGSSAVHKGELFWKDSRLSILNGHEPDDLEPEHRALYLTGDDPIDLNTFVRGEEGSFAFAICDEGYWEFQVDYAPYSELFPYAKLVVHQGGIGTTAQALRAGVPQIIVPFAHDQPDNASRIDRLGVGVKAYVPHGLYIPSSFFKDSYTQKAHELGEKIRAENGPLRACETIEKLASA